MANGVIQHNYNVKLYCIQKEAGEDKTALLRFYTSGVAVYAFAFGRFGWDSGIISFSVISHVNSGVVSVLNLGQQSLTATCTGDLITLTTQLSMANFWVISPYRIT